MFIYFWRRERHSMSRGGAEREDDTESKAGSRLWAVSTEPDVGLRPRNLEIMTWAEIKSRTLNWLSHPGAPQKSVFWIYSRVIFKFAKIKAPTVVISFYKAVTGTYPLLRQVSVLASRSPHLACSQNAGNPVLGPLLGPSFSRGTCLSRNLYRRGQGAWP